MTHADSFLKGYTTLKKSAVTARKGFNGEQMLDIYTLGTKDNTYCVHLERKTAEYYNSGFLYCGTSLEEANNVYNRHMAIEEALKHV